VIKDETRNVSESEANDHIAGFVVVNDVSMRDFQNRTTQFMQGKIFEGTTPVGPELVTPDEVDFARDLRITTTIDGEVMQDSRTSRLIFSIPEVISYISSIITLSPGDLISTGTPSGVGAGRVPKVFLKSGQRLVTTVEGVGELVNLVR
jgi:acylpyruvate hydrolase